MGFQFALAKLHGSWAAVLRPAPILSVNEAFEIAEFAASWYGAWDKPSRALSAAD
jgi:hypothetical protein